MELAEFLNKHTPEILTPGPHDDIVMSSRIRLARNLNSFPFPGWARKPDRLKSLESMLPAVEMIPQMKDGFARPMDQLNPQEKQLLVERHLISREHAAKGAGSASVISPDQSICVMINEEDHLRMQALMPGLQLDAVWKAIDAVDNFLEKKLDYAFNDQWGYLTACPTNLGTGIRVSAMLHLPGLVLSEQINQIIQSVNKLGLAVRGLYGEGTEALGNVFQVSNQMTLGETEQTIIERLNKVLAQIIEHEQNARDRLLEKKPHVLLNHVGRAYGTLANAHIISSKETMNLLSLLKLGIDIGLFPSGDQAVVDELFLSTQPAHLQQQFAGKKLSADERDLTRAEMLRSTMKQFPQPLESLPKENNPPEQPEN